MTEDAFLEAILENEDDDAPRLVFADWLEENGQPERAEFIRCQCLWARLPRGDARREELRARCRLLLKRHGRRWAGLLGPWLCSGTFRRGFLDTVTIPAQVYLEHAADIDRLIPVRRFTVDLTDFRVDPDVGELVPESVARENVAMPIGLRRQGLVLAVEDAEDFDLFQKLGFIFNREIELVASAREQIISAINAHYGETETEAVHSVLYYPVVTFTDPVGDDRSPIAELINFLLVETILRSASQVRLEPRGGSFLIHYGVHGASEGGHFPPDYLVEAIPGQTRRRGSAKTRRRRGRILEPVVERLRQLAAAHSTDRGRIGITCGGMPFGETDYELSMTTTETPNGPRAVVGIRPLPRK
jgi:uncharacterized protein (TIGR02996 family)